MKNRAMEIHLLNVQPPLLAEDEPHLLRGPQAIRMVRAERRVRAECCW